MSRTVYVDGKLACGDWAAMGRPLWATTGGVVYHVLNRAKARMPLYDTPADYLAVERVLAEAWERIARRTRGGV